jgi:hypothetical protein
MSKALKAFDKVSILQADGSNWDTWKERVDHAAKSIKYDKYLTWNPYDEKSTGATEDDKDKDSNLLNAIIGRLSDGIFRRYKHYNNSAAMWTNLIQDYDSKNALTESHLQRRLHTM